jgi:alkylated DNA repair protein alkB family protein 8
VIPKLDAAKGAVVFQRYYHLFTREELVGLVEGVPGARVLDVFYDKSNWCIVFERAR